MAAQTDIAKMTDSKECALSFLLHNQMMGQWISSCSTGLGWGSSGDFIFWHQLSVL